MRTTIDINDALLQELRQRSGQSGTPFKRVVNEVLQAGLGLLDQAKTSKPYRVKSHPLGLKPAFRGQSMNQLYDQLEAEDSAK
ncbi:MAG: DUF2191 domain-containing protein [Verrucomicrobiota bacterium]